MEGINAEIELVLIFRNEAMDATHLAEFFQVEGVVADYDITLGHLIGMPISLHPLNTHLLPDCLLVPLSTLISVPGR